ncbi:hypothetical protein [Ruficoccus sp. ZRK36]|uniref:hypothetical protein n=1 Tax=Ruficoccus sp. ZRK36 TaxID=2866311 RepID=UPI001C72E8E7|nr:hypothetical protein [Ruficoccus sp. ZRK36]QYY36711.1 hypothetical protein K0V07_04365 [Ruficoccus sp. ZRK36]
MCVPPLAFGGPDAFSINETLNKSGYERDDLFILLKQDPTFASWCRNYSLDDPSVWSSLLTRLELRNAQLMDKIEEAQSMSNTGDMRSFVSGRSLSKADIRARGEQLLRKSRRELEQNERVLNAVKDLQGRLDSLRHRQGLTDPMTLENAAGQSIEGCVVMLDGLDAIIYRSGDRYYRIALSALSVDTQETIYQSVFAQWDRLPSIPGLTMMPKNESSIAYDNAYAYVQDDKEGLMTTTGMPSMTYEKYGKGLQEMLKEREEEFGEKVRFYLSQISIDQEITGDGWRAYLVEVGEQLVFIRTQETVFYTPGWAERNLVYAGRSDPIMMADGSQRTFPIMQEVAAKKLEWRDDTLQRIDRCEQRAKLNQRRMQVINAYKQQHTIPAKAEDEPTESS